ncbi:MAG TPA: rod shape-determining protein [Candidatus Pullichristensenella excrementigallinarum]|uniref:Cell shape-determining protein MreB n=1 Tax=Candidatus Pullichristensenella excrementigallinarum TaxID=2840907 RepID=A0A9D1IAL0_9FIRM|nr:rod shape-determining protein [Candidatus Pullichristensenella excrementigallinarum]
MGVFSSGGVGIDLGSANVTIYLENEGVVLREPSYLLMPRLGEEPLAVGRDARQMLGRTPEEVFLLSPVMDGAVGDAQMAALLMQRLSEKAIGRRKALERSRVVVSVSQGATKVERAALLEAIRALGARRAAILRSSVAAAIGAGVNIFEPKGAMMVVVGGSTTEVAVISMGGIAAARSQRTGSLALDEAIMRYMRNQKGLIIGQRTAEDLKIDIGTAKEANNAQSEDVLLRGRDARSGKPGTISISSRDVHKAMEYPLQMLLENIRDAFENTPPELAVDILDRGIYLSGGGAKLEGLKERLEQMLNMPVLLGENPEDDVANGLGVVAKDDKLAVRLAQAGVLMEL